MVHLNPNRPVAAPAPAHGPAHDSATVPSGVTNGTTARSVDGFASTRGESRRVPGPIIDGRPGDETSADNTPDSARRPDTPTFSPLALQIGTMTGASTAVSNDDLTAMAGALHVTAPDGSRLSATVRRMTLAEAKLLLVCDETSDYKENLTALWDDPQRYYRWNLDDGSGEIGLINDIARRNFYVEEMGPEAVEALMPTVVEINGRIAGVATFEGDPIFHVDATLREQGYKGIGTVLLAAFIANCHSQGAGAHLCSVNNSYGFYGKLGFKYEDADKTPTTVANAAEERFGMFVPHDKIAAILKNIADHDHH